MNGDGREAMSQWSEALQKFWGEMNGCQEWLDESVLS